MREKLADVFTNPYVLLWFYAILTLVLTISTIYVMTNPKLRNSVPLLQFVSFFSLILTGLSGLQGALAQREVREQVGDDDDAG